MSLRCLAHLDEIGNRISTKSRTFLFVDFDGTLSPIVPVPALASLPHRARDLLAQLGQSQNLILGVTSGRRVADLQWRVALPGLIYAGNYGLEIRWKSLIFVEPRAAVLSSAIGVLAANLKRQLADVSGVTVEDKGLTLSIHFRHVPPSDLSRLKTRLSSGLRAWSRIVRVRMGRKVLELYPNLGWHTGSALQWILNRSDHQSEPIIYIGDDATDEDAFSTLPGQITIRVGSPRYTRAAYYLETNEQVLEFLEWLAALPRERQTEGH
jgi:trehalose-phosphatase